MIEVRIGSLNHFVSYKKTVKLQLICCTLNNINVSRTQHRLSSYVKNCKRAAELFSKPKIYRKSPKPKPWVYNRVEMTVVLGI